MVNWKKGKDRDENLTKLLSLLTRKESRFYELKEKLNVSEPTLTEYIKKLESKQQIEAFLKSEGPRQKWYRIKPESKKNVETQIRQYEAIKFIEGMENPLYEYQEKNSEFVDRAVALFYSGLPPKHRAHTTWLKERAKESLEMITPPYDEPVKYPNAKIAIVLMMKAKGGEKQK